MRALTQVQVHACACVFFSCASSCVRARVVCVCFFLLLCILCVLCVSAASSLARGSAFAIYCLNVRVIGCMCPIAELLNRILLFIASQGLHCCCHVAARTPPAWCRSSWQIDCPIWPRCCILTLRTVRRCSSRCRALLVCVHVNFYTRSYIHSMLTCTHARAQTNKIVLYIFQH